MEQSKLSKPEAGRGDALHTLAKAGLSSVPIFGGAAAELFSAIIIPPLSKRRDEWIESIVKGLKALEEKIDGFKIENLSKNEAFITTVMHATQAAIRNHQKEKLEALRNAVLNSALPNAPDEDMQAMFLNFVDTLTPWHLRLLKFFENPREYGRRNNITYPSWSAGGISTVIEHVFPELKEEKFYQQIIKDLSAGGLIKDIISSGTMTVEGMLSPRIKPFGTQFLRFIASPIEV